MTFDEIYDDVDNIPITEFMEAIGEKPVKQEGDIITYNAPYNIEELVMDKDIKTAGKPTCLVDTRRNVWRDKNYTPWQPLTMLALEMTWSSNPDKLRSLIANVIYEHRKKQPEVKQGSQSERVSQKQKSAQPKRKMRF